MSSVPNRLNVKLARLFYKYDEPRQKPEQLKPEKPFVKPEDYEAYAPYNFSWFVDGKIAAMGFPRNEANLNYLVDAGVHHLITLSPERHPPIEEFDRKLRWTEIRIKEFGAPTLKQILKFIELCERAEIRGEIFSTFTPSEDVITCADDKGQTLKASCLDDDDGSTYRLPSPIGTIGVHCHHGRGRTGTMLACYLVHFKGMAPERAVLTVRIQRPGSCETYEQEKIVCHYHDCVRGTIPKPDYRLLEDKTYFDMSMKYTYGERESTDDESEKRESVEKRESGGEKRDSGGEEKEKEVKLKRRKKKTHAMVINHKIYF